MSQMKAYCFKCEAELDPEAIVCPACGRPQRSMIVRSVKDAPSDAPQEHESHSAPNRSSPFAIPPGLRRAGRFGQTRRFALVGAGILGLFLFAFAIGRSCGSQPASSTPAGGSAANVAPTQPPAATKQPGSTPTAPPATPTPQLTGSANFVRVNSDIPGGHCSTTQGCPVTGTFKNNGGRGGGTVTFSLLDSGGTVVGTYSAPLPVTDPGGTADVSGYANGDQLPAYLKSGGLVQLKVDVRNT